MAIEITIPRLGWSMEEGAFGTWLRKEGEKVAVGDALFALESDKSLAEIESLDSGILRFLPTSPQQGEMVKVGQLIGYLASEGEALPSLTASHPAPPPAEQPQPTKPLAAPIGADPAGPTAGPSSPRARRVANELGVDLTTLKATGKGGRIRERDVRAVESSPSAPPTSAVTSGPAEGDAQTITVMRRTIAERMMASLANTAPVTLTRQVDATALVALRSRLKSVPNGSLVPAYTDIIAKLSAVALLRFPIMAAQWHHDRIVLPGAINIGIAVDTEHGLLVPVIRDVPNLALPELVKTSRALIEAAHSRRLKPENITGGVFTISNLGSFGIDAFTPIINYPEAAILGLGAIRSVPVLLVDGSIAPRDQITLSLTFDHRIVDGAPAARFLQVLCEGIADPAIWLLGYHPRTNDPA